MKRWFDTGGPWFDSEGSLHFYYLDTPDRPHLRCTCGNEAPTPRMLQDQAMVRITPPKPSHEEIATGTPWNQIRRRRRPMPIKLISMC